MSDAASGEGIGQPVRRKEDYRFITGNGHYTDDINRPRQTFAYFLRSPHAHARIKSIDTSAAEAAPGVVAVFTGKHVANDGIGGLICGWTVTSKDGTPMKVGPHPILALDPSLHTRRHAQNVSRLEALSWLRNLTVPCLVWTGSGNIYRYTA